MDPSLRARLRKRPVTDKDIVEFTNREMLPFLSAVQDASPFWDDTRVEVRRFGAMGDARPIRQVTTTDGSDIVALAGLSPRDIGKAITLIDAGEGEDLNTTIADVILDRSTGLSTSVVLAVTASASVTGGGFYGTDDSDAILAAVAAAGALVSSGQFAGSTQAGCAPEVDFGGKAYLIRQSIAVPAFIRFTGGAILCGNDQLDIFTGISYSNFFYDLELRRYRYGFKIATNNADKCILHFNRVRLLEGTAAGWSIDNNSDSTQMIVGEGCEFSNLIASSVGKVAEIGRCDHVHFSGPMWTTILCPYAFTITLGRLELSGLLGVPNDKTGAWVQVNGQDCDVLINGMTRFGGEGGGKAAVEWNAWGFGSQQPNSLIIKDTATATPFVDGLQYPLVHYKTGVPAINSFDDITQSNENIALRFGPAVLASNPTLSLQQNCRFHIGGTAYKLIVGDPESEPTLVRAALATTLRTVQSGTAPKVSDLVVAIRPEFVIHTAAFTNPGVGVLTGPVDPTALDPWGDGTFIFTCTTDETTTPGDGTGVIDYATALDGLTDGPYTAVFAVRARNYPVNLFFRAGTNAAAQVIAPGGWSIVNLPFEYVNGLAVNGYYKNLQVNWERVKAGAVWEIARIRVFKGFRKISTYHTEFVDSAYPTTGLGFAGADESLRGDIVRNSAYSGSNVWKWECTTTGVAGAGGVWSVVQDPIFTGASGGADGTAGRVPKPVAGQQGSVLLGSGVWATAPNFYFDGSLLGLGTVPTNQLHMKQGGTTPSSQGTYYVALDVTGTGITLALGADSTHGYVQSYAGDLVLNSQGNKVQINSAKFSSHAGSPEGSVTGSPGDFCCDTTNGEVYVKNTGTSTNTGWKLVTHA